MSGIDAIGPINYLTVRKVLSSPQITDAQKAEFIKKNAAKIKNVSKLDITQAEFKELMSHRELVRGRPITNSFIKKGDDIIFAKSIGIQKNQIKGFINSIIDTNFEIHNAQDKDRIEQAKTYVYRHGTKDQVVAFLGYELSDVKTVLHKLYNTLEYNSGGLADYFNRPIHRMDNITMSKLYRAIDKSLINAEEAGVIDKTQLNSTSEWALVKIYQIQNNSKLIRAYELYKDLT